MWIQYLEKKYYGACQKMCAARKLDCLQAQEIKRGGKEERGGRGNDGSNKWIKRRGILWEYFPNVGIPEAAASHTKQSMHMLCRPVGRREGKVVLVVIPFKLSHGQRQRGSFLITRWSSLIHSTWVYFYFGFMVLICQAFWRPFNPLFALFYVVVQSSGPKCGAGGIFVHTQLCLFAFVFQLQKIWHTLTHVILRP